MRKNNKGITLIALIVTIIILIIIAGISIAALTSDNGIIRQTDTAKVEQIEGTAREQVKLAVSAMRLAIAEAHSQDNSYSARQNGKLIQQKLIDILNADKNGLTGVFDTAGIEAGTALRVFIGYTGDDYKNACNDENAKITYVLHLAEKSIELIDESSSILKDENNENVNLDIGHNMNFDTLVENGVIHVDENGVLTTNFDLTTSTNLSSDSLYGELIIPSNTVKTIGQYAFTMCLNLTSIVIPDDVETIEKGAFAVSRNRKNSVA